MLLITTSRAGISAAAMTAVTESAAVTRMDCLQVFHAGSIGVLVSVALTTIQSDGRRIE
jgi:hypothetical protein